MKKAYPYQRKSFSLKGEFFMKKNNQMRSILSVLIALMLSVSLTACGASKSQSNASYDRYSSVMTEEIAYDEEAPMEAANPKKNVADAGSALNNSIAQTVMPDNLNLKLIWRANISMETLEFDQSIQGITNLVNELGGFVESSSNSGGSDAQGNYINKYAYFTIRIPSDKLNGFIGSLNDCGTVTSQRLSSENISLQYADTEARKAALQTEYDRLLELMAQAENVDAVIAVEARLSEVRLQLDSLSSELRTYDNLVDYSTIYLDVQEVRKISGTNAVTIPERIKNGFSNTLYGIKTFAENLIVFLVVNIPVFIIIAVIILIIRLILKKLRLTKHKNKKADSSYTSENAPADKEEK